MAIANIKLKAKNRKRGRKKMAEKKVPVKVGDEVTEGIIGFGKSGDPFIKFNEYIIFVKTEDPSTYSVGDMVRVKLTKTSASYGFGGII